MTFSHLCHLEYVRGLKETQFFDNSCREIILHLKTIHVSTWARGLRPTQNAQDSHSASVGQGRKCEVYITLNLQSIGEDPNTKACIHHHNAPRSITLPSQRSLTSRVASILRLDSCPRCCKKVTYRSPSHSRWSVLSEMVGDLPSC